MEYISTSANGRALSAMNETSGKDTVLVVDDDPALLRLVSILLQTEGFAVETNLGGSNGLSRLAETKPDLLLLDLGMPVIDGREFYRRARDGGFSGPIVICSAFGAKEAERELGADGSIAKPFDPGELGGKLRAVIEKKSGLK
jgi:DNA-binding response OmpR family regulator